MSEPLTDEELAAFMVGLEDKPNYQDVSVNKTLLRSLAYDLVHCRARIKELEKKD